MAARIAPVAPESTRQRRPRMTNERHLRFIRQLPCVVCGARPVDPAHLRAGNRALGKRPVGKERPDDMWVTPLCRKHHDEQHASGDESAWWRSYGLDPYGLAMALFLASYARDTVRAEQIVHEHFVATLATY